MMRTIIQVECKIQWPQPLEIICSLYMQIFSWFERKMSFFGQ